jgi:hypothetical protein
MKCTVTCATGMHCYMRYWYALLHALLACTVTCATGMHCYMRYWYVLLHALLACIVTCATGMHCYMRYWYVLLHALLVCIVTCATGMYCYMRYWYVLLHALLVCIRVYLKPVLRYEFLISDSYHLGIARMWGSVIIFRSQKESASKKVWETLGYSLFRNVRVKTH